jgi:hypothetical protein
LTIKLDYAQTIALSILHSPWERIFQISYSPLPYQQLHSEESNNWVSLGRGRDAGFTSISYMERIEAWKPSQQLFHSENIGRKEERQRTLLCEWWFPTLWKRRRCIRKVNELLRLRAAIGSALHLGPEKRPVCSFSIEAYNVVPAILLHDSKFSILTITMLLRKP